MGINDTWVLIPDNKYNKIWNKLFWKQLKEGALTEKDVKTLYNYGYKVYRFGGYETAEKFFAEQLELLQGDEKCQNNTRLESASGFLSLLARLLSCCASLKKLWKLFR